MSAFRWKDCYPSLFAGSYSTVSQICWVAPGIKINHSDSSTDRSIRTVRQLEQVFEPYRRMFMEMRGEKSSSHRSVSVKERNTLRILKHRVIFFLGGGCQLFADFGISPEWFRNFTPTKSDARVY